MKSRPAKVVQRKCDWCHKPLRYGSVELEDKVKHLKAEVCMPCFAEMVGVDAATVKQMAEIYS